VFALLALVAIGVIAAALTVGSATETLISANYRTAHETFYAAEAGLARAVSDLQRTADWSLALGGAVASGLQFAGAPAAPDGRALDLPALTRRLQAESDAEAGADPDRPVWTLFGHGPLSLLLPEEVR
jgi:Tfp pilus assembly protein PilX